MSLPESAVRNYYEPPDEHEYEAEVSLALVVGVKISGAFQPSRYLGLDQDTHDDILDRAHDISRDLNNRLAQIKDARYQVLDVTLDEVVGMDW